MLLINSLKHAILVLLFCNVASGSDETERGYWPNNVVPYYTAKNFTSSQTLYLKRLFRTLETSSCLRFVEREGTSIRADDFISFQRVREGSCRTFGVGYENGSFVVHIRLLDHCFDGNLVMHEILHALGFEHEHQRADRDCYVNVDPNAIAVNPNNFVVLPTEDWLLRFPYDKYSVMLYPTSSDMQERGFWPWRYFNRLGSRDGTLTETDWLKLQYKFCNGPHYCDKYKSVCEQEEAFKRSLNCTKKDF